LDERIADGLYYGNSVRLLLKYLENPSLLCERLPDPPPTKKELKKIKKENKKKSKNK